MRLTGCISNDLENVPSSDSINFSITCSLINENYVRNSYFELAHLFIMYAYQTVVF